MENSETEARVRKRGNEIDVTGQVVAYNLKRLRRLNGLDLRGLNARLVALGRPISAAALSKIENLDRRVEVDDLMALALALDTNPNALLLQPVNVSGIAVAITGAERVDSDDLWKWAQGEMSLAQMEIPTHLKNAGLQPNELRDRLIEQREVQHARFRALSAPHLPSDRELRDIPGVDGIDG